jgi:hypothetical protein
MTKISLVGAPGLASVIGDAGDPAHFARAFAGRGGAPARPSTSVPTDLPGAQE